MINKSKFPRYFIIGFDTGIKVDYDPKTDEVFGVDAAGRPFSPTVALVEGEEVDHDEYKRIIRGRTHPFLPNNLSSLLP